MQDITTKDEQAVAQETETVKGRPRVRTNARNEEISEVFWHSVETKTREAGISRAELSRRSDLSNQTLSSAKYLKTTIKISAALRLTKALGCTIEDLLYGTSVQTGHRDDECTALVEQVKAEKGTKDIPNLTKLFCELTKQEQDAVLVHIFSLMGVSPKEVIEKMDGTEKLRKKIEGTDMRKTYNNYATDEEQKVTACPDWVLEETSEMWKRIDETVKKTRVSINKLGKEYNFSPSSVYNTIAMVRRGETPRDTELRIVEALADSMNVSLNYLIHGDQVAEKAEKRVDESLVDSIFSLANGNRLTLFLMAIPYMSGDELDAIRDDILTRFK